MTASAALSPLAIFAGHDNPVNHIAFGSGGHLMATADTAMVVKVWQDRELVQMFDLRSISDKVRPTERVRGIRFNSGADRLFVAAGENVWCLRIGTVSTEPEWTYSAPRLFAFLVVSPTAIAISDKDTIAAAFDNGTIASWDVEGHRTALIRHNASPRQLEFVSSERLVGTDGFSVSLWDTHHDGRRQAKPVWHRTSADRIYGMAATHDGRYIALRSLFTTLVQDFETGAKVAEFRQGRGLPLLVFAPRSHTLAIGMQHAIQLQQVDQREHFRLSLDDAELISLAFLPDGSQLVGGCSDGCVRTWDNPFMGATTSDPITD